MLVSRYILVQALPTLLHVTLLAIFLIRCYIYIAILSIAIFDTFSSWRLCIIIASSYDFRITFATITLTTFLAASCREIAWCKRPFSLSSLRAHEILLAIRCARNCFSRRTIVPGSVSRRVRPEDHTIVSQFLPVRVRFVLHWAP